MTLPGDVLNGPVKIWIDGRLKIVNVSPSSKTRTASAFTVYKRFQIDETCLYCQEVSCTLECLCINCVLYYIIVAIDCSRLMRVVGRARIY
jgi:hypothetical protein